MIPDLTSLITALRGRVSDAVFARDDPGFAEEVAGFNAATINHPDVVVGASSAADIAEAVRFAVDNDLAVRVQATGHSGYDPVDAGMLVSTRRMRSVRIDPETRIATIGAGARWKDVVAPAAELGLAPITGSSPTVGVVGLVCGGGLGPLSRSYGFSADHVRGFTVVTANGDIIEATADEHPDLFWALRGGKGGLGIVAELRYELVPIDSLYAGALFFDEQHMEAALRAWAAWTATAPESVTTSVALTRFPPFDQVPEPLRGRFLLSLRFAYPGDLATGEQLASPLRAAAPVYLDTLGELPLANIGAIHGDPEDPMPVWDRGMMLASIDQDFVTALLRVAGPGTQVPMIVTEIRHLGAATATDVVGGSAVGGRTSGFTFELIGAPDPSLFEHVLPTVGDAIVEAVTPWLSKETNINFAGRVRTPEHFASAWPPAIFERLASVRKKYDPRGLFTYGPISG